MAWPVHTISAEAICFEALLKMIRDQYDHLVVEQRKQILGVIAAHDIIAYQGALPLYLFREIAAERDIDSVYALSEKVPAAVRTLIEEGAKGGNISRVITLLNDCIVDKILDLLIQRLGPPPVPFSWLTMGSDGRKEQTFRTDQDNALVYRDPVDDRERQTVETYFDTLAQLATEHLVACGYPPCKSGFMASNPRWCKPYSVWENYFDDWMTSPEPKEVAMVSIFFDFRPVYGDMSLGSSLRQRLTDRAQRHPLVSELLGR